MIFLLNTVIFIDAALNISLRKIRKCNVLSFYLFGQGDPNETKGTINLKLVSDAPRLEHRSHAQVRTQARTQASARTHSYLPWPSNKTKSRCTVIAHTKEPSLTE